MRYDDLFSLVSGVGDFDFDGAYGFKVSVFSMYWCWLNSRWFQSRYRRAASANDRDKFENFLSRNALQPTDDT